MRHYWGNDFSDEETRPPRKARHAPAPDPPPSLSSLEPVAIKKYLDSYKDSIDRHTSRDVHIPQGHASSYSLTTLDSFYRNLKFLTPEGEVDLDKPCLYLGRFVVWKVVREKYRHRYIKRSLFNKAETCKTVCREAETFLKGHLPSLNFDTSSAELHTIIEECMRIWCQLKGVTPAIASAIVAAWTPVGIFQSDALLKVVLGTKTRDTETWALYRRFYMKAIEILNTLRKTGLEQGRGPGRILSGKYMERVAWSMMHPAPPRRPKKGKAREEWDDIYEASDYMCFYDSEETIETSSDDEDVYRYGQESYLVPKKRRRTKEDGVSKAKEAAKETGQDEGGRRRSKRIKTSHQAGPSRSG